MSEVSIVVKCTSERWSYGGVSSTLCSVFYNRVVCVWVASRLATQYAGGCVRAMRMCSVPRVWVVGWTRRYVTSLPTVQNLGVGQWTLSHTAGAKLGSLSFRAPNNSVYSHYYNPFGNNFSQYRRGTSVYGPWKIQLLFSKGSALASFVLNNYLSNKECGFVREYN